MDVSVGYRSAYLVEKSGSRGRLAAQGPCGGQGAACLWGVSKGGIWRGLSLASLSGLGTLPGCHSPPVQEAEIECQRPGIFVSLFLSFEKRNVGVLLHSFTAFAQNKKMSRKKRQRRLISGVRYVVS